MLALTQLYSLAVTPASPTEESIQGSWVGLPYQVSDYCRLVLTNGRGLFARSYELEKAMIYTVVSYKLDREGSVMFELSAASTNAYPVLVSGKATHYSIRIVIRSPDGGWSHESVLYREETVEGMFRDLRKSMEQVGK